jgi:hypothetical protein
MFFDGGLIVIVGKIGPFFYQLSSCQMQDLIFKISLLVYRKSDA